MPLLTHEGRFKCIVRETENWIGEASTGSLYVGIPVEVAEGDCAGEHITAYLYLTEAANDRTLKTLEKVIGFDGDLEALYTGRTSFAGLPCSIVTEYENNNLKVKWLNSAAGGNGIQPASEDKVKALLAKLKKMKTPKTETEKDDLPY